MNIPLVDAIEYIISYEKILKEIISKKRKLDAKEFLTLSIVSNRLI